MGSTDREQIRCDLLARIAGRGFRSIGEIPPQLLASWFHELNSHGGLTPALADGEELVGYAARRRNGDARNGGLPPPPGPAALGQPGPPPDLPRPGAPAPKGRCRCSGPP